ncbi:MULTISPECIES: RNA polymerase sigma factor [unclassified Aurantimonas]|nr:MULTISPECIES: RNA polymerase sigma factor [unclassified Aurantimonas]MEC5413918.1 RNA polymerase sigma factor [Aurantimonas sp. C2-4-R8]
MTHDRDKEPSDSAVRAVIVEIHQDLLRFLTRRLGNADEAADVLHDFYVKVLTRFGDVRETEKLRAWMRRVLETTLIDHYRAQGKKRQSESDYRIEESVRLDGEGRDDLDFIVCMCLYKLLPTLKADYADVLWRADLIGESRESIAAGLGITESNLRVRLHRARQALRQRLKRPAGPARFMAISTATALMAASFVPKSWKIRPNCNERLFRPSICPTGRTLHRVGCKPPVRDLMDRRKGVDNAEHIRSPIAQSRRSAHLRARPRSHDRFADAQYPGDPAYGQFDGRQCRSARRASG